MCDNFWYNVIWHNSPGPCVLCWRIAESDIIVMPSVPCMYYVGDIIIQLMFPFNSIGFCYEKEWDIYVT